MPRMPKGNALVTLVCILADIEVRRFHQGLLSAEEKARLRASAEVLFDIWTEDYLLRQ